MKNFDIRSVTVTVGTTAIQGFGADDAVVFDPGGPDWELMRGPDGAVTACNVTALANPTLKISLQSGEASAAAMSALSLLDRTTGVGVLPIGVADANGHFIGGSTKGRIIQRPTLTFGKGVGALEWTFALKDLEIEYLPVDEVGPPF